MAAWGYFHGWKKEAIEKGLKAMGHAEKSIEKSSETGIIFLFLHYAERGATPFDIHVRVSNVCVFISHRHYYKGVPVAGL